MIKTQALVSVVIPCYNAERFIKQTINSVLKQTYQNFEILVINDGSTDNSLNFIQSYTDSRIAVIDKANSGVSDTRNIGYQKSKGQYILFLDSDDVISENYFSSAIDFLENNRDYSFCTFHIRHIDENDKIIENIPNKRGTYQNIQEEIAIFHPNVSACPSTYIYRKCDLEKYNIKFAKNLKSAEDRHFLFQVGKHLKGTILSLETANLFYRINQKSLSHHKSESLLRMQEVFYWQTINDKLLPKYLEKKFSKKMSYQLISTFVRLKEYKKVIKYSLIYLNNI